MIRFFLGDLCMRWLEIEATAREYQRAAYGRAKDRPLVPAEFQHLAKIEGHFEFICQTLDLELTFPQFRQFEHALKHEAATLLSTHILLKNLMATAKREMAAKTVAFIAVRKAPFFEADDLFGKDVSAAFRSAVSDIRAAGNCLAANLNTAAVFHLMRVVERGLMALAADLSILPADIDSKTWGQIMTEIDDGLDAAIASKIRAAQCGTPRNELKEFYHGIMGEFRAFRDVWRNNVMHGNTPYTEEQATRVFEHVREFMARMATQIKEVPDFPPRPLAKSSQGV